ncbi:tetratricopeptide repeat protein, partial [Mycobacterium sp. E188]
SRSNLVATVRADLLRRAGRPADAVTWYREALAVNGSEPGREFLRRRIAECGG